MLETIITMFNTFKLHEQLRSAGNVHVCPICHKKFNLKATLKSHKRTKHNDHAEDQENVQKNIEGLSVDVQDVQQQPEEAKARENEGDEDQKKD